MVQQQLPPFHRYKAANQKAIDKHRDPGGQNKAMENRRRFSERLAKERLRAIDRWYREGGNWFINWVKTHYRRWSGEALIWKEPYQWEYYLLLGNPWIERVIVEKGSQVGFSESLIALDAFVLSAVRVPTGLGFEAERKLRDMVPRIQASFDHIEPIQQARSQRRAATGRKDTDYKERKITIAGVECTFFYTSTASKNRTQERQASSAMSSFTAWVMLGDEIELWGPGTLDVATERQSACEMPTKPFRAGSTPGHEGGIVDTEVRNSGYLFMWRVQCSHCGEPQFLQPFGNLLKPVMAEAEDGTAEERYIDITGRPLDWFSRSTTQKLADIHTTDERQQKIETAFLGCSHCGTELDQATIATGHFACQNTGERLQELCDRALETQTAIVKAVALRLPRLASLFFNPAERIRKLLTTRNPTDQIQQGLGIAVTIGSGRISLPRLLSCVGMPLPEAFQTQAPDLIVLGVDQGLAHNWGMVQHWYLGTTGDSEQRWLNAHVQVVWWGEVLGFDGIDDLVARFNVDLVGVDNEPEVQIAAAYARKHIPSPTSKQKGQVFLFDQVKLKGEDFRRGTRNIQGVEVPVFSLHRTFGLDSVRDRIYRKQQHFPKGITFDPNDSDNLLYHYLTSDRRADGTWVEVPGSPDHLFHCDNFCSAAVLVSLYEPKPTPLVFGSLERRR